VAIFDVQGFGALSEWNGQFSSISAQQAFQTIAALGSNSVELTARIWTQTGTSTAVFADPAKTESDTSLLAGFKAAQAAGLSVVFKAALSPLNSTPVSSLAPADVAAFFASYKAEIVHLATVAEAGGVSTFAIGNEMSSLSGASYRGYWTDIIASVREVFHGELTYAAATDEASRVSFWDQLDTIGVNTYPPLTKNATPTVQDLVDAWSQVPSNPYWAAAFEHKSPVDFLHALSEQYDKPVLMTEAGYRSISGTAVRPGSWTINGTADPNAQADAYKAFFEVWTANGGSWLKGVELWQWDLNNKYNTTGYSVMGKPAEAVVSQYFHADGGASGPAESAANGLHDIYMTVAGKGYASEHDVIDANGKTALIERFFADGTLAFSQTVNADRSVVSASYDASGHLTQFAIQYLNGTFDQLTFDATGAQTSETVRHADGTRDIHTYGITGAAYVAQHVVTDASGHSILVEQYRTDGTLLLRQTVDGKGAVTLKQYDVSGHLSQQTVTQKDGTFVQDNYANDGSLSQETQRHADGTRDICAYNIAGKAYASQHVVTDASGHSVLIEQYRTDGSLLMKQTVDTSGIKTLDQFDALGHLVQETVTQASGTYVQTNYRPDGTTASITARHLDGSKSVDTYGITGQSYSARHDHYDAAGKLIATTFDNKDGSHSLAAFAAGVTLTATSGDDVMNSAGADTFVFNAASGHHVVNNFHAGDAAGHDVLAISSALVSDVEHLVAQVVGHDAVIDLGHGVNITLTGVTALTAHDVLIV
jgi:hypothetical protein